MRLENDIEELPKAVLSLKLPSIDILNALDYRATCLRESINKLTEKQPEGATELQKCVNDLIEVGKARKAINRNKTYLVTELPKPLVLPDEVTAEDVRWMLKPADHDDGPKCRIEHAEYIGALMWNACLSAIKSSLQKETAGDAEN